MKREPLVYKLPMGEPVESLGMTQRRAIEAAKEGKREFIVPKGTELRCFGVEGEDCEALIATFIRDTSSTTSDDIILADGRPVPKFGPLVCPECGHDRQRFRYPDEGSGFSPALRARALAAREARD